MNIAIFTNNYLPNPYGVTNSIESFRKEFEKRGHRVFIFAPRWKGYQDENSKVFRYPALDIEFKIKFPLPIPYSLKMNRLIKKLDLDIIHSQHPNLLGTAAAKWAKKKKIPLIFTWHTLYDQYAHFFPFLPAGFSARYIIKKAVRYSNKADGVIAPTDSIIPILKNWGVTNKITAIPTGIEAHDFENADGKPIREKYGVKEDEVLLLVVTRLTQEKNVEFLLCAVIPALKSNKKIKFMLAAGGYFLETLKKIVRENSLENQVIFTGQVTNEVRKNYFAAGDIFVFASKSETQGMVISEAMYSRLPIVAVDATGVKSLVLNNGNGFLVGENITEFSEAILKLVKNKELRNKFSEASKQIANAQFTSEICADKMLEVYKKAIENYKK